ncbi:MAG: helix-turn-helix transcriptional regulator, partial [bacterium]|nr:helix-turn-helix transcriptional regulator [bacterium]
PTISEIESGRRKVSADELLQFAELYKVDTAWLLHEEKEEDYKFAARELSKLSKEDREKVMEIIKLFPKKES